MSDYKPMSRDEMEARMFLDEWGIGFGDDFNASALPPKAPQPISGDQKLSAALGLDKVQIQGNTPEL